MESLTSGACATKELTRHEVQRAKTGVAAWGEGGSVLGLEGSGVRRKDVGAQLQQLQVASLPWRALNPAV